MALFVLYMVRKALSIQFMQCVGKKWRFITWTSCQDPISNIKSGDNDQSGAPNERTGDGEHVSLYIAAKAEKGVEGLEEESL